MESLFILCIILMCSLSAENVKKEYPGLSASVINVPKNDVLNIREKPTYKSNKVGSWSREGWLMIAYCVTKKQSTWCRADADKLTGNGASGWVNAHYLKFLNEGFVIQKDGQGESCMYATKCEKNTNMMQCYIMDGYYLDKNYKISSKGKWIDRSLLIGGTVLSTAKDVEMCGNLRYDMQYNAAEKLKKLYQKNTDASYRVVIELLRIMGKLGFYTDEFLGDIKTLIHPDKGVIITDMVRFGDKNEQHFSQKSFGEKLDEDKDILWGYSYGKGDPIRKSLYRWIEDSHREIINISKIETLRTLKDFPINGYAKLKAYEVYWINEASDTKEYDWLGLVVILSQDGDGKWYIVGLLRDRWTI